MASVQRQWARTERPRLWASFTMEFNSATEYDARYGSLVRVLPPEAAILMKSAPCLISWRTL